METKIQIIEKCRDSLVPCLIIEIDFKNTENCIQLILGGKADLYLNPESNSSQSLYISSSDFEIIARTVNQNDSFSQRFKFRLSPWVLKRLEKQRKKDIHFNVYSEWITNRKTNNDFSITSYEKRGSWSSSHRGSFQIPQSRWIELLEEMDYSTIKIFELPMPDIILTDPFTMASEFLKKAQKMLMKHDFKEVLTNCRLCHEELEKIVENNKVDIQKNLNVSYQGDPNFSRFNKFDGYRIRTKRFCHMGPHSGYFIELKDAELALFSTLYITKYLFEITSEIKSNKK